MGLDLGEGLVIRETVVNVVDGEGVTTLVMSCRRGLMLLGRVVSWMLEDIVVLMRSKEEDL